MLGVAGTILVSGLFCAAVLFVVVASGRTRARVIRSLADQVPGAHVEGASVVVRRGPLTARVTASGGSPRRGGVDLPAFRLLIDLGRRLPTDFAVRPESGWPGPDVLVGDVGFDALARLTGRAAWVSAVMSDPVRRELDWAIRERGLVVGNGRLGAGLVVDGPEASRAAADLERLLRLLDALTLPRADVPGRLADHARHDPMPGVRRHCAERLFQSYPRHPEAARLAAELLPTATGELRLLAAKSHVGDEGGAALQAIAADLRADPVARIEAIGALADPSHERQLLVLLKRDSADIRRAAARALGQFGSRDAVQPLRAAARTARDNETRNLLSQAADRIQAKLGPAQGALAVLDDGDQQGALSVAPDARLSLAKDPSKS